MNEHIKMFASWDHDTQSQCVALYQMAASIAATKEPTQDVKQLKRRPAIRRASVKKSYRPRPKWSDEDRLALFEEFSSGNTDFRALAQRFGRTELAIRAQFDKTYASFRGMQCQTD